MFIVVTKGVSMVTNVIHGDALTKYTSVIFVLSMPKSRFKKSVYRCTCLVVRFIKIGLGLSGLSCPHRHLGTRLRVGISMTVPGPKGLS
jgi:hypothetical protein